MKSPYQIRFWKGEKWLDNWARILPQEQFKHMLKHRFEICVFGPGVSVTWFKKGEQRQARQFYLAVSSAFKAGKAHNKWIAPSLIKEIQVAISNAKSYMRNS